MGFGAIGGITTADVLALAREIAPGDELRFLRVIRTMDALFLDDAAAKAKQQSASKK
jgi:hypothetical protein